MPFLDARICGTPSQELSNKIALVLTDITAEVLKKKRELTAVTVSYVAADGWFIGGTALSDKPHRTFYLDIKVTEGTNTKDEKAQFVSRVFGAIEAQIGALAPASYVVIQEVPADAWGYEGRTQEFRYIGAKIS